MNHRFAVLDIFRGLFASLLFCFHLNAFLPTPLLNNSFITNTDVFVDLFFVLSGFVISYVYQSIATGAELFRFYKKRLRRLYPLHLLMLFVFVALELGKGGVLPGSNNITSFFSSLFLLNSIKMPGVNGESWNYPSWSISAEVLAYLVFGALTLGINRAGLYRHRHWFYIGVVLLGLSMLRLITGGFVLVFTWDYGCIRGIVGFFTGALCFMAFSRLRPGIKLPPALFTLTEATLLLSLVGLVCAGAVMKRYGFVYEGLFFLIILVFAFEMGALSRLLSKIPVLHRIGECSYSIYMTHALLVSIFAFALGRVLHLPGYALSIALLPEYVIVYYVSRFTWRHVEMRFYHPSRR